MIVFVYVITCRLCFFIGTDIPRMKYLIRHVIPHIIIKWYEIGVELLDMCDESKLKIIKCNHPGDVEKCAFEMLKLWLETEVDASWNKLIQVFKQRQIDLFLLAFKIENMLDSSIKGMYI